MSDGILSQDEIDALLGSAQIDEAAYPFDEPDADLSAFAHAVHTAFAAALGEKAAVEPVEARLALGGQLSEELDDRYVFALFELSGGASGPSLLLWPEEAAALLTAALEAGELAQDAAALEPALGRLGSQLAAVLSEGTGVPVEMSLERAPWAGRYTAAQLPAGLGDDAQVILTSFTVRLEEAEAVVTLLWARALLDQLVTILVDEPAGKAPPQDVGAEAPAQPEPRAAGFASAGPSQGGGERAPWRPTPPRKAHVREAQFSDLRHKDEASRRTNLDFLLDVPLQLTVELGRTNLEIRQILELGKGSVVELDKLAGEPVEIYVNGKLIAKGEVVTIDENFGVKIVDIVSKAERVNHLG